MKQMLAAIVLLVWAAPAMAQYGSADYSVERWTEDYSYLKYPGSHNDAFDPIKFIPLGASGDNYLSFGGQVRYRYDYFNNSEFGSGTQDEHGFDLVRLLGHVDAHLGPNLRAFVQLDSGLLFDRSGGPRAGDADDIDVQQAFVDLTVPLSATKNLLLRVGRQELIYGAQRLISPNDWGNVRRSFEGARLSLSTANDTLDAFLVRPVIIEKGHFNSGNDRSTFAGLYNVMALPDVLSTVHTKLDAYLLFLDNTRSQTTAVAQNSEVYTLGLRPHGNWNNWDFDLEADWQFGSRGPGTIDAYSLATEAGYTFTGAKFAPRASLGFDIASGSANPGRRFNQLFPPLYTYLGHLYLFGRENIIDLHPAVSLNLTDGVTLTMADHLFWRQNANDAVYNLSGGVVRAGPGSRSRFIGDEFDITANWQVDRHLALYAGWAHLFTGAFLNDTGPHSDPDFFYAMFTYTF